MKRILSIALALMIALLPCAMAETVPVTQVGTGAPAELTVTGSATVAMPADAAMISLGVRETAEDVQEAQATVNHKIDAIRTALVELGIDNADITTESLYIYANYNYDSAVSEIVSYSANNTLSIVVRDIDATGTVIDTAFAAGANTLDSVSFYATDDSAARDQAYTEAVADAVHKAKIIAQAAGMDVLAITAISESIENNWYDNGLKLRATGLTEDAAAATDVQASSVMVTANVSITYTAASK